MSFALAGGMTMVMLPRFEPEQVLKTIARTRPRLFPGAPIMYAAVIDHPSEKYYIQHYRRRKNYRRFKGHRQPYTEVEILYILRAGEQPPAEEEQEQTTQAGAPTA